MVAAPTPECIAIADVYGELNRAVRQAGGQAEFARQHDIPPAALSDVLNNRRHPGPGVLGAIGLRRVVRYERVKARP